MDRDVFRVVCISDTHNHLGTIQVPEGDLLIHAGDFTYRGTLTEVKEFAQDFARLPHRWKLVIAGNHDLCMDRSIVGLKEKLTREYIDKARKVLTDNRAFIYLEDSGVNVEGYAVWGSPWIPKENKSAFTQLRKSTELTAARSRIPPDTDILVTHCPPRNHCDYSIKHGKPVGCDHLARFLSARRPLLSVFGHIHEGHGVTRTEWGGYAVNAAICNREFVPANSPIVIDLPRRTARL